MRFAITFSNWTHRQAAAHIGSALLAALALAAALPVCGQATNGAYTIGIFRASWSLAIWYVDSNGSHAWEPSDLYYYFGLTGDIPVMGDWTFTGQRRMGIFRDGYWYADTDDSRSWTGGDSVFAFGLPGDQPFTINLDDGYLHLAVFRPSEGAVYVDTSQCNCPIGATYRYQINGTQSGDVPLMINADGQGGRLAFYRPGTQSWYLGPRGVDLPRANASFDLNAGPYQFGLSGDLPVAGDWTGTGSGVWNIGVYRGQGLWVVDSNGSHAWEVSDAVFNSFGLPGDVPVMGPWALPNQPPVQGNPSALTLPVTDSGKGPRAAGSQGCPQTGMSASSYGFDTTPRCGARNCTVVYSYIAYLGPTQMYGCSGTYSVGPEGSYITNSTTAGMTANGADLGSYCVDGQNRPIAAISGGDQVASARVPCNIAQLFSLFASNRYALSGTHQAVAYGYAGQWNTYYTLGFVPAGSSGDFGVVQLGPFNRWAPSAPTILPADGVAVQYIGAPPTPSIVSVHLDVPYGARKGLHQLGFPTTDIYGYSAANQVFDIIVYDATPAITTVSPSAIPAEAQTSLTITGSGFGDHPTVYVSGTRYDPGAPTRNPQTGKDVVTVSVTLPLSKAGTSVPVYLVSNGAGYTSTGQRQVFFGAPQGSQQGSPTSNTVQVQVQQPGPTIFSISPNTSQIGASGVQFTISGSHFGTAAPTLSFGSSGITNVLITSNSDTQITGTFDVPRTASPGQYTLTLTPRGQTQTATATFQLTPAPPTISGETGIWWLGPNFTTIPEEGYYDYTLLTLTPGAGATPPSPDSPALWTVTPSEALQYVSIDCLNASCAQVRAKLTAPPPGCGRADITVQSRGLLSDAFRVDFDQPLDAVPVSWDDQVWNIWPVVGPGYLSENTLELRSACRQRMMGISVHEEFPTNCTACGASTGAWTDTPGGGRWTTTPIYDPNPGQCPDTVGEDCAPGTSRPCSPASDIPGTRKDPPVSLSTRAHSWCELVFYVGSQELGKGFAVVPNRQVRYTDHGRDEPWNWTCPAQWGEARPRNRVQSPCSDRSSGGL
jgi:hypothetical protein